MKTFHFENKLFVITQSDISNGRGNGLVVKEAIKGGAEIIQLREKNWNLIKIREEAKILVKICHEKNVLFILNDYVDIALEVGADGVHLGQKDISIKDARKICRNKLMIGLSTHSVEQAIDAEQQDVDYITIGPIYKTRTKEFTVGPEILKPVVGCVDKPVIAVGGINKNNIDEVLKQGVRSVAVASAVVSAEKVMEAANELVKSIKNS
jgi:thiamine-phosphate pyrophosphorylase